MKKLFSTLALMFLLTLGAHAEFLGGFIYNGTTTPGGGYTPAAASKQGQATCKNIWYIVTVGDCSVRTAMKNGNIKSLAGYDVQRENILGFQTITVKAWGN
ncbi:MAG: hypothetical protein IJ877_03030 [Candidatus Gastranaerophilales bacterium]|nr:hypothetical protein [Candidatus Gastranaerophilales bacterium]